MRTALITNDASGGAGQLDLPGYLRELGAELELFEIEDAMAAAGSAAERIIVAGGDGSIGIAAHAALEAGVPLGVVPAGTANDFAARMGLPDDLKEAAQLAGGGSSTRKVDLARAGDRAFVNVASLGLPPAAADIAADMKERLGALAYTVGALRAGLGAEPTACRVRCDGEDLYEGRVWQVTVGCTGAFGGGSSIDADADDGRLDVVVIEDGPRARLAKHALGLRSGGVEEQEGVRSARCREIAISAGPDEELNVDGELVPGDELRESQGEPLRFVVDRSFDLVIG